MLQCDVLLGSTEPLTLHLTLATHPITLSDQAHRLMVIALPIVC